MNKINFTHCLSLLISVLFVVLLFSFSACTNKEDENDPCATTECLNGGEKNLNLAGDACECDCPNGFTGELCETPVADCTGVECPEGQEPNPENDCLCE